MRKPKIFVSSTIIDFEDLRSALKFFLEEYGYDVQMSEYPNFNIDPDYSAMDTCIKNLEKCDYYILLIGYRRGSWYKDGEISITHMEYLSAKFLIEKGHPLRIIAFVRKPIWLLKSDRNNLIKHFSEKSKELSKEIASQGSTIIDDPDYIFNFINAVSQGVKFPGSEAPANNWIFDFNNFEEIVTAIKHTFNINESLEVKRIKKSLIKELESNFLRFQIPDPDKDKTKDKINTINILDYLKVKFQHKLQDDKHQPTFIDTPVILSPDEFSALWIYSVIIPIKTGFRELKINVLEKIVNEGLFFHYDTLKGDYEASLLSLSLEKLLDLCSRLMNAFKTDVYEKFLNELNQVAYSQAAKSNVKLSALVTGVLYSLLGYYKIPHLISGILRVLKDDNYEELLKFDFSNKF